MALRTTLVLVFMLTPLSQGVGHAEVEGRLTDGNPRLALPRRHLNEPFDGKIFLAGHVAIGGDVRQGGAAAGFGGSLIFRPGSTLNIFDGLFDWNTGMVLQADYLNTTGDGHFMSYDLILRRYFANRGDREVEVRLFLGLGSGLSEIVRPRDEGSLEGDYWSIMAEGGQEWYFKPHIHFYIKGQYRWMISGSRTYQTWTAMAGAGFPLP